MSEQRNPFDVEQFSEGGFLDDVVVTVKDAKVGIFTYPSGDFGSKTSIIVTYALPDGGKDRVENYSIGDPKFWTPSADGKTVVPVNESSTISKRSKAGTFMRMLHDAGFVFNNDITPLVGKEVHLVQVPTGQKDKDGNDRTMPCIDQILGGESVSAPAGASDDLVLGAIMALTVDGPFTKPKTMILVNGLAEDIVPKADRSKVAKAIINLKDGDLEGVTVKGQEVSLA